MELRQLEYVVAVAEEASFTRAAARVHVAQPGVSAQVRRLERELGQDLFDRSGRSVRLTRVGAAVLPYARAALAAVAGARSAVDELAGLVRGQVAVGSAAGISSVDVPELLAEFHRDHPAVDITLAEDTSDRLVDGLRAGDLDLAVLGMSGRTPAGIDTQVVVDEPLVAVVSHLDPLARKASITVAGLRGRALISLPRGTGVRASLDGACAAAGFQPRIAFEAGAPQVLARLAGRGLGIAILAKPVAEAHSAEVHAITITRPQLRARIELAWRADGPTSPAAKALIGHARAALG